MLPSSVLSSPWHVPPNVGCNRCVGMSSSPPPSTCLLFNCWGSILLETVLSLRASSPVECDPGCFGGRGLWSLWITRNNQRKPASSSRVGDREMPSKLSQFFQYPSPAEGGAMLCSPQHVRKKEIHSSS